MEKDNLIKRLAEIKNQLDEVEAVINKIDYQLKHDPFWITVRIMTFPTRWLEKKIKLYYDKRSSKRHYTNI